MWPFDALADVAVDLWRQQTPEKPLGRAAQGRRNVSTSKWTSVSGST
jgi:hypothetical protein